MLMNDDTVKVLQYIQWSFDHLEKEGSAELKKNMSSLSAFTSSLVVVLFEKGKAVLTYWSSLTRSSGVIKRMVICGWLSFVEAHSEGGVADVSPGGPHPLGPLLAAVQRCGHPYL